MTYNITVACLDEPAMQRLGRSLLAKLPAQTVITLSGELGAGKSVLARAMIHGAGYKGHVKSPTYTLIENYEIEVPVANIASVAHLDLYRLTDPDELHFLGVDEIFADVDLVLIEWPEMGGTLLPAANVQIQISYAEDAARKVMIVSDMPFGPVL